MSTSRCSLLAGAAAASLEVAGGANASSSNRSQAGLSEHVALLTKRAADGHAALMRGDLTSYRASIMVSDDFLLMSPFGGTPTRGAELTDERWESVARFFAEGRDTTVELVQAYRAEDMVVLALIERGHVAVGGLPAQDWALRVTLVFRRDGSEWRLVHRHADPLVRGISLEHAAEIAR